MHPIPNDLIAISQLNLDRRIGGGGGHLDSLGLTIRLFSLGLAWTHLVLLGLTWFHMASLALAWLHWLARDKRKPPGAKREKGKRRRSYLRRIPT